MKLLQRTYISTAIWFIPVMIIGGIYMFFMIKYISDGEVNEFLIYEMERLEKFNQMNNDLPEYQMVADIIPGKLVDQPTFRDTLILETGDMEMAPYRELLFTMDYNDETYTIVLRHLLLGRPDIAEGTLLIMIGLLVLIYLMMFLAVNRVAGKHWKPFYVTLATLSKYNPEKPVTPLPDTNIEEFNFLNSSINRLCKRIQSDFRNMKEYNENASHELQTHLAVIKGASENVLSSMNEDADLQLKEQLGRIHSATTQLSYIQRSLLLLSRIGNHEFNDVERVNVKEIAEALISNFEEMMVLRDIKPIIEMEDKIVLSDMGLMKIMINNLLKNAVKYNMQNGFLKIKLDQEKLVISNPGETEKRDSREMVSRYTRGEKGNLGIGLAIVNQICDINGFLFRYHIVEKNIHQVEVFFQKA